MHTTYRKGQIAVCRVLERAAELGWIASIPFTEARYDLVLDQGDGKLLRVQVKYCDSKQRNSQCSVRLDLRKECRNNGKVKTYSSSEIDVILVYIPQVQKICWLRTELFHGKNQISIRLSESRNKTGSKADLSSLVW